MKIYHYVKSLLLFPFNLYCIKNELQQKNKSYEALNLRLSNLELNLNKQINSLQKLIHNKAIDITTDHKSVIENHFLQIESLFSIYNLLPNLIFLPATRGWAGSPDFLNKIVEIILKQKPRTVVEASSGVSSIIIGVALKLNNYGRLLSLEHDDTYLDNTRNNLKINHIEDISSLLHCPLDDYHIDGKLWKWYQTNKICLAEKIDLLIVDGPPGRTQNLARYPAIPLLFQYFSESFTVLLDDAKRPDEVLIVEKWIELLSRERCKVNVEYYSNYEKGLVVLNVKKEINYVGSPD